MEILPYRQASNLTWFVGADRRHETPGSEARDSQLGHSRERELHVRADSLSPHVPRAVTMVYREHKVIRSHVFPDHNFVSRAGSRDTGAGTNNAPCCLQNLLLQRLMYVIL